MKYLLVVGLVFIMYRFFWNNDKPPIEGKEENEFIDYEEVE